MNIRCSITYSMSPYRDTLWRHGNIDSFPSFSLLTTVYTYAKPGSARYSPARTHITYKQPLSKLLVRVYCLYLVKVVLSSACVLTFSILSLFAALFVSFKTLPTTIYPVPGYSLPLTRSHLRIRSDTPHPHNLQTPQLSIRYTVRYGLGYTVLTTVCGSLKLLSPQKPAQPRTSLTNRGALPADTRRRASATSAQLSLTHMPTHPAAPTTSRAL